MKSELRRRAVERLPAGKQTGILTHFQTRVKKKTNKKNSPQRTQRI
jgi:hypothetical protein